MKIGINASLLNDLKSGRGVFLKNLLSYFSKSNEFKFVLFFPFINNEVKNLTKGYKKIVIPNGEVSRSNNISKWDSVFTKSESFKKQKIDLLFQPYFKIPKKTGKWKLVVTVHDLINQEYLGFRKFCSGNFPYKLLSIGMFKDYLRNPSLIKKADKVAVVSDYVGNCAAKILKYPKKNIEVIHNGTDPFYQKKHKGIKDVLKKISLRKNKFLFYAGGMVYRKNIGRLVKAYLKLPEEIKKKYPLVLAGKGFWEDKLKAKNYENVHFIGYVSEKELAVLYSGARAFVYPSIAEGFGLPVFEAAFQGTAVAVSGRSVHPEIAGDFALMFDPFNVKDISKKLYEILNHPGRSRLTDKLKKEIMKKYSWKKAADMYLKLFKEVLRK